MRRQKLPPELADEVAPKNILMIGPTGVGKTEIARRLAKLAQSPFLKVEASKFTEVGYVGRDVESMVRDLVEIARGDGARRADRRGPRQGAAERRRAAARPAAAAAAATRRTRIRRRLREETQRTRERLREQLREGRFDDRLVEIEVREKGFPVARDHLRRQHRRSRVQHQGHDAGPLPGALEEEARAGQARQGCARPGRRAEADRHGPGRSRSRVDRVQQAGIIFLDEIDKIAGREGGHGPDVSREGVQRDILPIVEGTTVNTKHGMVRTDHILFIAAGAFHVSKPSDLIPELQGRFPIRVELEPLGQAEFVRILTEPRSALVKQYIALMATEGVELTFCRRRDSS